MPGSASPSARFASPTPTWPPHSASPAAPRPTPPASGRAAEGGLTAGLTALPANPLIKAPEISYHRTDSGARILLTFEGFLEQAGQAARSADVPVYVVSMSGAAAADGVALPVHKGAQVGNGLKFKKRKAPTRPI